jgi:hypothetical protein
VSHHAVIFEPTRGSARIPRPLVAAVPLFLLAAASAALDLAPRLPWTVGATVAGFFLVAGLGRATQRYVELRRLRAAADRLIRREESMAHNSPFLEWRADELTRSSRRRTLARSLRHVLRQLDPATLPGASPLNRRAARPFAPRLAHLANAVDDLTVPITARGVLLAESFLTDPASPLYDRTQVARLGAELSRIEKALCP